MQKINFYVPSEAQILLTSESINVVNYRFHILEHENKLYLQLFFESYTDTEEIPEPTCKKICDMAKQHRLTNAVVNTLLLPLKKKLIETVPELNNQINISRLLAAAKGYISRKDNPIAVFEMGALHSDMFINKYTVSYTMPIDNPDKVILLSSKENLLQEQQTLLFVFRACERIYQLSAFVKNGIFYLQTIAQNSSMLYQDIFEANWPLSDIYRRFVMKKNRLGILLNKK